MARALITYMNWPIYNKPRESCTTGFLQKPWVIGRPCAFSNAGCKLGTKVFEADARYLAPFWHSDNTYTSELARRIKNLNIVFKMWRRCWVADGIPITIKTQFFKGIAIQILFSAIVAFALTCKNYRRIESVFCQKIRVILQGRACVRDPNGNVV